MVEFTAGWIGGPEVVIIVIVVLLLFGGKKIPELARGIGKGIRDFRKATEESDIVKDMKDVASELNETKKDVEKMNPKDILKTEKNPASKPGKSGK